MSDLIYLFASNAKELDNYFNYDPDANFYSEEILFMSLLYGGVF